MSLRVTASLTAALGLVLTLTACGEEEREPARVSPSPLTASATPTPASETTPSALDATRDKGCPRTFTEVAADEQHPARSKDDSLAALAILASPGKTRACVYSKDEDSPTDTLGVWEIIGEPLKFKEKWPNEAPQVTAVGTNGRTGPRSDECDTSGVSYRFVYARHAEQGSAYLVQDVFGCTDARAVTRLGAVDLTSGDTLLDLTQDATFAALDELRARMAAG